MKSFQNQPKYNILLLWIALFTFFPELHAQSTCGTDTLTSNKGKISDGSGSLNYADNLTCSWLIKPNGASIVDISFDSLSTELGHDSIVIYDGLDSLAPILGSFSGNVLPNNMISSDSAVFIQFITNGSINDKGFKISYTGINGCSGRTKLTAANGTFSDGSKRSEVYANQQDCEWLIRPPGAKKILLNFTRFSTELDFDVIEVFDGNSTLSPSLGTFSGTDIPPQLVANSGFMLIKFTSDISIQRFGWEANYISTNTHCIENLELKSGSGIVREGSDTNNYENNLNCSWIIDPNSSNPITFTFESFDTELNHDIVNIYDGISSNDSLLASYSGDTIPPPVTSTGGEMFVEFITNDTITSAGWEAFYSNVPGGGGGCLGTKILTDTAGTFTDGSGAANYKNNLSCGWLISPPGNPARITIEFDSMNTSGFGDFVRIFDGTDNSGAFLGFLSFQNTGQPMTAFSGNMFIEFITDNFGPGVGWQASYTTSKELCTPQVFTEDNGFFNDGSGFSADYENNLDCSYLIQPSTPNRIIRAFIFGINTEAGVDTLTIYDGPDASYPVLRTISGLFQPFQTIFSTGGSMFMTFKTNDTINHAGWNVSYNTLVNPTCEGHTILTASSGTFTDGSVDSIIYTENNNCSWLIDPPGASKISLNFNRFDTENTFDIVRIHDGNSANAPLIGEFSGGIIPKNIISSGGSLFLRFNTDQAVNNLGWEATYTSTTEDCFNGQNILTASRDTLVDGSDTANYKNNLNCSWLIQPVDADSIKLNFVEFDLAIGDTLKVFDGDSINKTLIDAYTSSTIPDSLSSTSSSLWLEFSSDTSLTGKGWKIFYNSISSLSCTGVTSLIAPSGTFSDGSNTDNYDNKLHCGWLIQPPGITSLVLTMDSIDLGNGDVVNVYDGPNNLSPLLRSYTGPSTAKAIATKGKMYVEFISDESSNSKGWTASYQTSTSFCVPNTVLTATAAGFNDGSGNKKYKNNTNCEWLIQPSAPNLLINLRFLSFETQVNKDSVIVYDGSTTSDPVLAVFTGRKSSGYLSVNRPTSTGGSMLVQFKTDDAGTENGWRASYITFPAPLCEGDTVFTDSSGTFNDGSADGSNYGPSSDCSWTIAPPHATKIELSFNYFDTQAGFDSLRVYDGNSNAAPLLGTFSGATLPSNLTANSGKMFLEFKTNAILQLNGWEAKYSATIPKVLFATTDTVFLNDSINSSGSFDVASSLSWTTGKNENWLILAPDSSVGDNSVTATAIQANTTITSRYAKAFIDAIDDTLTDTVIIAQKGIDHLFINPDTIFIDNQLNATNSYTVTSNITWITSSNASWLSQSHDTSSGNASVILTVLQSNIGFTTRFAKVFVDDTASALTDTIIIAQEGLNQLFISEDTIFVDNVVNGSSLYNVTSNTTWLTGSSASWFNQSPDTAVGNNKVTVTALQVNTGLNTRYGKAFVDALTDTIADTVIVAQEAFDQLSIVMDTIFVGNQVNTSNSYDVVSNITWIAGSNASWFDQSPDTANGSTTVTVTALQTNTTFASRFAKAFVDDTASALTDTIIIAQKGLTQLVLSADTIFLDNAINATDSFDVSSNAKWVTGTNATWFSKAPDTSKGNASVELTALQVNSGLMTRYAKVHVDVLNDTLSDTVVVAQEAFDQLSIVMDTIFVGNQVNTSNSYDVVSNITWIVGSNASWFDQSPDTANGSNTVTVTALQTNTTFVSRFAKAFVDDTASALTDTIIIAQKGLTQLVLSTDTIFLDNAINATDSFDVSSNAKWITGSNATWFSKAPDTSKGNASVKLTALQVNGGLLTRYAKVHVDVLNDTLSDTVIIAQEAFDQLSIAPDTIFIGNQLNASSSYDVISNITWIAGSNASWFDQSPDTANGSNTVTVTALQTNTTFASRFAKAFVDDTASALTDTIIIVQEGLNHISIVQDSLFLDDTVNSIAVFDVFSNAQWKTEVNVPWLNSSPDTSNRNDSVRITALQNNPSLADRFAKAYVKVINDSISDSLVIVQRGKVPFLSLNVDSLFFEAIPPSAQNVNIHSNINWMVTSSAPWISTNPISGGDSGSIDISTLDNLGPIIRSGMVIVSDITNNTADTIHIIQDTTIITSLDEIKLTEKLRLYPNPTQGRLTIELPNGTDHSQLKLSLISVLGKEIDLALPHSNRGNRFSIDLGNYAKGIYFLRMAYGNQITIRKISLVK